MTVRLLLKASLLCLLSLVAFAQKAALQADKLFAKLAYAEAAGLYEQALQRGDYKTDAATRQARAKLGFCYRQLRDARNAERVYGELIGSGDLPPDLTDAYLHYAQALASNGKFKEAQQAYETYTARQTAGQPGSERNTKLYRDVSALANNTPATYKVTFLDWNTNKAEFSPTYYQGGLVFVSAGASKKLRRVFKGRNGSLLDLYYVPESEMSGALASLNRGLNEGTADDNRAAQRRLNRRAYDALGQDDFTVHTANDSRTVGVYGGNQVTAGDGYGLRPLSESERFGRSLNSKYHEGPATFSRDGSRVMFTRNNVSNGQVGRSCDGVTKLKLYTARLTNGAWNDIEEMPFNSDEFSTGHPALSRDGQRLYFASDRPGGFGGTDLYLSRRDGSRWTNPVNLGPTVNTKGNELFPFVDEKDNLYFASNGLPGLGGLDVFYVPTTPDGLPTSKVSNVGEPINSDLDDFGLITDGSRRSGYFSSNRRHGGGDDDIYRFDREGSLSPCRQLLLTVYDEATQAPLTKTSVIIEGGEPGNERKEVLTDEQGTIRLCLNADSDFMFLTTRDGYLTTRMGFSTRNLQDDQPSRLDIALTQAKTKIDKQTDQVPLGIATLSVTSGEEVSQAVRQQTGRVIDQSSGKPITQVRVRLVNTCDQTVQETVADADGQYSFSTVAGCEYRLDAHKRNFATKGGRIYADGTGDASLMLFQAGDLVPVENIYYDVAKSTIRPDAALELDKVVELLDKYPNMAIELRSHTDSRATTDYNQRLSTARAKAAVDYIASKGIERRRLRAKGLGESMLINDCADGVDCTDEQHQQNRRTEIKILRVE